MPHLLVDAESQALGERFALIRTPRRRGIRYPAGCVTEVADEQAARQGANPGRHLYPALVYGPSRSSEGVSMFYLIRWLD